MKKERPALLLFFYAAAAAMALLGAAQIALYLVPQITAINDALASGYPKEEISNYIWSEIAPAILGFIINTLGFSAVLFACAKVYEKLAASPRDDGGEPDARDTYDREPNGDMQQG